MATHSSHKHLAGIVHEADGPLLLTHLPLNNPITWLFLLLMTQSFPPFTCDLNYFKSYDTNLSYMVDQIIF